MFKNILADLILISFGLFFGYLSALYFHPSSSILASSKAFVNACYSLSGKDLTSGNLRSLNGSIGVNSGGGFGYSKFEEKYLAQYLNQDYLKNPVQVDTVQPLGEDKFLQFSQGPLEDTYLCEIHTDPQNRQHIIRTAVMYRYND